MILLFMTIKSSLKLLMKQIKKRGGLTMIPIPASRKIYRDEKDLLDRERISIRYFICGIDIDPQVNLTEGYVSLWSSSDREIMVKSFYCPDSKQFYFDWIEAPGIKELDEMLSALKSDDLEAFISFIGISINKYKRLLYSNSGRCVIVNDLSSCFGYPIEFIKNKENSCDNFVDLMRIIEEILN